MLSRWLLEARINLRTLQLHKLQPTQGGIRLAETGLSGLSLCIRRGLSACATSVGYTATAVTANGYERQGGEAIYGGFLYEQSLVSGYGRILPGGSAPRNNGVLRIGKNAAYALGGDDDPRQNMTYKPWSMIGNTLSIFGTFTTAYTRIFSQSRTRKWRTRAVSTRRVCP